MRGWGMMRLWRFLIFAVCLAPAALAAPAEPPVPGDDAASLQIDAGRLDVMVDQSEEALKLIAPDAQSLESASDAELRAYAFQEIVAAVLRYNFVSDKACRAGAVDPGLCKGPYLPVWLKGDATYSNAQLRAMIDEATDRLMPFWKALCGKGRRLAHDESFCRLE